ncbi:hypothetical protein [Sebaldella sp. S0638]|uniref:hypothetical protein n=1 Tax=Sebaldella sp. S0638 TaxID=2957809 RepID=UPI00209DF945|nr:hypothetical protein [Sebaldella sp. S0638]MCP1225182.1 hypothetical protein [Sebaldella sp. S0638]
MTYYIYEDSNGKKRFKEEVDYDNVKKEILNNNSEFSKFMLEQKNKNSSNKNLYDINIKIPNLPEVDISGEIVNLGGFRKQ